MKVMIEISDSLAKEAFKLAVREHVTLRELVERSLNRVVRESTTAFKLRRASFGGRGLQAEFLDASAQKIRETAYANRSD